jgi:magnesium transporter
METHRAALPWIDVQLDENTTTADPRLVALQQRFDLHPIIVKELAAPSPRTRVEDFGSHLFLAYQFPLYDEKNRVSRRAEIDFIITKDTVVTVHYERLHALEFAVHQEEVFDGKHADSLPFELTYHILSHLLAFNQRQLRHISDKTEAIASELFKNQGRDLLERISYLKRDISEYRVLFNPIGPLIESLIPSCSRFFGPETTPYLNDLRADYLRIFQRLEDYRAAILDYEATNTQLLNARNGDVMRVLTMMSFITFPLVLIAALFAVRLEGMPLLTHPHGFWILLGLMALLAMSFFLYFKRKGWI